MTSQYQRRIDTKEVDRRVRFRQWKMTFSESTQQKNKPEKACFFVIKDCFSYFSVYIFSRRLYISAKPSFFLCAMAALSVARAIPDGAI